MERSEVQEKYKWKISDVLSGDEEWEKRFAELEGKIDFAKYRGTLNTAENVLAYFRAEEAFETDMMRVYLYAFMRHDEDVRVTRYNSYMAKIMNLATRVSAETSFAMPELSALPDETLAAFAKDERLRDYDYVISRIIARKKYTLSEAEEKILAQTDEVMGTAQEVFTMLDNAELNLPEIEYEGKKVPITHGLYSVILSGSDQKKRAEVFSLYYSAYRKIINTLAATYYGNVKKDIFYKNVRGFESCLDMALFGEDVDRSVYENLIASVNEACPVMHRYIADRKKALGYDEMHMYDLYIPLVENAELKLTYEEAYDLVVKGLAPLGEEYVSLLQKGRDERWIDVCETEGKRSGAYSIGNFGTQPFVLRN